MLHAVWLLRVVNEHEASVDEYSVYAMEMSHTPVADWAIVTSHGGGGYAIGRTSLSLSLSLYLCLCVCVSLVSVCQRDDSKSGTRNIHGQSLCHTEEMIKFWARFGKSQTGIGSDCGFTAGYFQKSCGWTAVFCGVAVDVLRDSDCRNLDPGQGLMRITVVNPSLSVSPLNFWPLPPSFLSILHITTSPNFLKNSGVATPNIQLPPSVRAVALSCRVL